MDEVFHLFDLCGALLASGGFLGLGLVLTGEFFGVHGLHLAVNVGTRDASVHRAEVIWRKDHGTSTVWEHAIIKQSILTLLIAHLYGPSLIEI